MLYFNNDAEDAPLRIDRHVYIPVYGDMRTYTRADTRQAPGSEGSRRGGSGFLPSTCVDARMPYILYINHDIIYIP